MLAFESARLLSMLSFLGYGLACLLSDHMTAEFERFGLSKMRRLTGALEVLGALGIAVGYFLPPIGIAAAVGLTLLMLLGVATRVRVGDPPLAAVPALALLLLNAFIAFQGWNNLALQA